MIDNNVTQDFWKIVQTREFVINLEISKNFTENEEKGTSNCKRIERNRKRRKKVQAIIKGLQRDRKWGKDFIFYNIREHRFAGTLAKRK